MAKKKPAKPTRSQPAQPAAVEATGADVRRLRSAIDELDRRLVELVNERASLALRLGAVKDALDRPTYDPQREEEIIRRAVELNKGPLGERCVAAVLREVISGTRSLKPGLRVAYLGPAYSYSHLAAIQLFGQSEDLVPVGSITAVFEEVDSRQSQLGIVPLENSTDGRIADTLDNFARRKLRIRGEVQLRIHHYLLGRCPRADVQEVYSRPQALSQCRNWLAKHLPTARLIEVTSTSTAAQLARDKAGAAAIASRQAGVNYGLDVLAGNIEDNASNVTRFALLGHEPAERTGNDKSAAMFELEHRAGALADAITVFKRNRVNLTWIESFPMSGPAGGYLFFVELEGHQQDTRVRKALQALARKVVRVEVLGSYAKSEPVD
ncbi:MAG: prephenate dehydratase [Pirellulales bacterium]